MQLSTYCGPTIRRFLRDGYRIDFRSLRHLGHTPSELYAGVAWLLSPNGVALCRAYVAHPAESYDAPSLMRSIDSALRRALRAL